MSDDRYNSSEWVEQVKLTMNRKIVHHSFDFCNKRLINIDNDLRMSMYPRDLVAREKCLDETLGMPKIRSRWINIVIPEERKSKSLPFNVSVESAFDSFRAPFFNHSSEISMEGDLCARDALTEASISHTSPLLDYKSSSVLRLRAQRNSCFFFRFYIVHSLTHSTLV